MCVRWVGEGGGRCPLLVSSKWETFCVIASGDDRGAENWLAAADNIAALTVLSLLPQSLLDATLTFPKPCFLASFSKLNEQGCHRQKH